jgi:predicted amidophosphoribosyltransferase
LKDLGDCPLCFGRLLPLSLCQSCNSVVAREGLEEVGPTLVCEDCGATNPTHFVCSACNARFPFPEIVKAEGPTCPVCKNTVPQGAQLCPHCSAVLPVTDAAGTRPRRRIRGEYGEEDVHEVGRIPGVGRPKAEALCAAGYNALWKIARATETELSRVKGIGPKSAQGIKESLKFLLLVGRRKTKEEVLSEEYECPLCGTLTSLFSTRCHDCGAEFDEEELDEEFRREVEREEDKGLLAYYDVRLLENPDGSALHYARGALLFSMRRPSDALSAFERVIQLEPTNRRAVQAKARALAGAKGIGAASQVLREDLRAKEPGGPGEPKPVKVEEVEEALESLDTLEDTTECPECGEKQVPGATLCPVCGHRFGPQPAPGPPAQNRISLDEERLLDELERAVAGEKAAPPPPLRPEVPAAVVDKKRAMLAFLLRVPGISRRAAEAVSGFFQDLEQIGMTEVADLADIPGVAPAEARLILGAVVTQMGPIEDVAVPEPVPVPPRPKPRPAPEIVEQAEDARPAPRPVTPKPAPAPQIPVARRPMELAAGRRGLINGRGLVNGRGRVNGLINGTGFVNGSSLAEMRLPRKNFLPRYIAIGAAMIMLFAITAALVAPTGTQYLITIDGNFQDWDSQHVPLYRNGTRSSNPNIEFAGVSVFSPDSVIFLRGTVSGTVFADTPNYDTLYAFLDTDGNATSGYDLGDLGADFLVQISGSAGTIEDARLSWFDTASGRARGDWNAWTKIAGIAADSGVSDVEVAVPVDLIEAHTTTYRSDQLRVRFAFDDNAGETSHVEFPVGSYSNGGALRIAQNPVVSTVPASGSQRLLQLDFGAFGGSVSVSQISVLSNVGWTSDFPPSPLVLAAGSTRRFNVSVDPSGLADGEIVFARLVAVLANRPYAIVGVEGRAYVTAPPAGKVIDGLFAEWNATHADSDSGSPPPVSLNILRYDGALVGSDFFTYTNVEGRVLEGTSVPHRVVRPPPGGPGGGNPAPGSPPPPAIGLDYVRFYLDSNSSDTRGLNIGGVFADRLIEVHGRGGRVTNASWYEWSGTDWQWRGVARTGVGLNELEASAFLSGTAFATPQVLEVTGDWSGTADSTLAQPTRAGTRGSGTPVVMDISGNQRYWFHDGSSGEPGCTINKVASSTQGTSFLQVTISSSQSVCWDISETSGTTIPAGTWETLLDIASTDQAGTTYNVLFQIWNKDTDSVSESVGSCSNVGTYGDDVNCQASGVSQKSIASNQVVRVRIEHAGGSGTVTIDYDDSDGTGDSRATLPIPEFSDVILPVVVVLAILVVSRLSRERRSHRSP